MKQRLRSLLVTGVLPVASGMSMLFLSAGTPASARETPSGYVQHNLVSNDTSKIPADHQDPSLVNPWGDAFFPFGFFWLNENASGKSVLYQGDGTGSGGVIPPTAVTVPTPPGGTPPSAPTGIVANFANGAFAFNLSNNAAAFFVFDTEDGTISAWNIEVGAPSSTTPPSAELEVDNSAEKCSNGATGAVYKGLALGANVTGVFIYATNFRCGTVDAFDATFKPATLRGSFHDPDIPDGFAPFGIANIQGNLFVTFALQDAAKHDNVPGPGLGFVDIFDTNGNLITRFASRGQLNSPWGVVQAPFNFGPVSNDVLIGDFGDGKINVFDTDGRSRGQLKDSSGKTITIDGLWSLVFGGAKISDPGILYFTAGPNGETDGLFGSLTPQ